MAGWDTLIARSGAVRIVYVLAVLYLAIAVIQLGTGSVTERFLDVTIFATAGLVLAYGARRLARSDISPDVYPRIVAWCLGGFALFLGVVGAIVATPSVQVDEILWSLGVGTAIGSTGGLVIGLNEARALSRARDLVRRNRTLRRYETLFEESTDVNAVLDETGRFTYVTPSAEHVLGYDSEELVGEVAFEYMHPDDREATMAGFAEIAEQGRNEEPVVFRFEHADGSWVVLEGNGRDLTDDPDIGGIVAYTNDVTERERLEDDLRAERDLRERIVETSPVGIAVVDPDGTVSFLNERGETLLGRSRATLDDLEHVDDVFEIPVGNGDEPASGGGATPTPVDRVFAEGEPTFGRDLQVRRPDGTRPWVSLHAAPIPDESGGPGGVVLAFEDVTDRKRNHERLVLLNELSRELTGAETPERVADLVVGAARETLDLPLVSIAFYDEGEGRLGPAARTEAMAEVAADSSSLVAGSDLAWRAFVEQAEIVTADATDLDDPYAGDASGPDPAGPSDASERKESAGAETTLRSVLIFPLGDHGVFVAGATCPDAFTDTDVSIASMLAAATRSALDRVDREHTLRERKDTLEEKTAGLQRLQRINDTIRSITDELIRASTRGEVVDAICTELTSTDDYAFAWVGAEDAVSGEVVPEAWAGADDGYLDAVTASATEDDGSEPAGTTARTGAVTVENSLSANPPFEPWERAALERGYQAAIAVPLSYQDSNHGVLALFAARTDVFDSLEETVLTELGRTIGYALTALDRKRALVSEESVELQFELRNGSPAPFQFAAQYDCEFAFENVVLREDGRPAIFMTIRGAPSDEVLAFCERSPDVEDITLVRDDEDGTLFELHPRGSAFFSALLDHGAMPRTLTATGENARAVIRVPSGSDVRTYVDLFAAQYEECDLVGRREIDEPVRTRSEFRAEVRSRLTERQREIIETAYVSGFFDWPREITAQELAATLGVSQPTVSRHIRTGERALFGLVFDEER